MPGHYQGTPPPPKPRPPAPPRQAPPRQDIDFWESKQGDGSAGTYRKKKVPGSGGKPETYTPERD